MVENELPTPHIEGNTLLCKVAETTLSVAETYTTYAWSNGATAQSMTTATPGLLSVQVTDNNGCTGTDSVSVISATAPLTKSVAAMLCAGASYTLPSGKQVSDPGVYSDTLHSDAGCDSLVTTVTLSILSPVAVSIEASICEGTTYTLPDGTIVSTASIYTDTLHSQNGCDSIIHTTDLRVLAPAFTNATSAICAGSFYTLPTGKTVSEAGVYTDTLHSISGCDSLVHTVNLSVFEPLTTFINSYICAGQWYTAPSGKTYTEAGDYTDTLHSISGCDSLLTKLHLSLLAAQNTSGSATICAQAYYTLPSGTKVNQSGVYIDTLRNVNGCDSLISTTQLTVKTVSHTTDGVRICSGATYLLPSGKRVGVAGTYVDTLQDNAGCDSLIVTTNLSVLNATKQTFSATFCNGSSYTLPWGETVTSPGMYADTIYSNLGCDSIINSVSLSVFAITSRTTSASICTGQTYLLPSGAIVTKAGTYSDTLHSQTGCDSLITQVNLSVIRAPVQQTITGSICSDESYTLPSGKKIYVAGTYRDTIVSKGGCDSLISFVTLTVQPKPVFTILPLAANLCAGDSVLLSASGGNSYQWYTGNTLILENSQSILIHPLQSVVYTAIVTNKDCQDSLSSVITVHPSPALSLRKSGDISCAMATVQLKASGASQYQWFPAGTLTASNISNPLATPQTSTVYHVQATSEFGCVSSDSIEVKVIEGNQGGYLLPSAFTPNGDGRNDCFGVSSWGAVANLRFSVFDRTGKLLFATRDASECWDGNYNQLPMQSGTYVYQVSGNTLCGYVYRSGTVVLIR